MEDRVKRAFELGRKKGFREGYRLSPRAPGGYFDAIPPDNKDYGERGTRDNEFTGYMKWRELKGFIPPQLRAQGRGFGAALAR